MGHPRPPVRRVITDDRANQLAGFSYQYFEKRFLGHRKHSLRPPLVQAAAPAR